MLLYVVWKQRLLSYVKKWFCFSSCWLLVNVHLLLCPFSIFFEYLYTMKVALMLGQLLHMSYCQIVWMPSWFKITSALYIMNCYHIILCWVNYYYIEPIRLYAHGRVQITISLWELNHPVSKAKSYGFGDELQLKNEFHHHIGLKTV
jgi:hypothetical protein